MLEHALFFRPSAERVCEANGQIGYEWKQSCYSSCLAVVIPEEPLFGHFALLLRVDRAPCENLGNGAEIPLGSTSNSAFPECSMQAFGEHRGPIFHLGDLL